MAIFLIHASSTCNIYMYLNKQKTTTQQQQQNTTDPMFWHGAGKNRYVCVRACVCVCARVCVRVCVRVFDLSASVSV